MGPAMGRRDAYGHGSLRSGTARAAFRLQGVAHPVEHHGDGRVVLDVVPSVVCFDRIVVQVVELPLIGQRCAPVPVGTGAAARREVADTGLGPGRRIVEDPDQLPECSVDPPHEPLEVRRDVGRGVDPQRQRRLLGASQTASKGRCARVALEHVVVGHQIHRPVPVSARRVVDDRHQIAAGQRVHFAELVTQCGGGDRLVDAGRGEQRRDDVDVRRRGAIDDRTCRGVRTDTRDRERDAGRLVVEVEPLLVQAAVRAEQIAVVGCLHDDGVGTLTGDGTAHSIEWRIDLGVQPVVEVSVLLRPLRVQPGNRSYRPVSGGVRLAIRDLCCRFGGEILVLGGRLGNVWRVER